MSRKVAIGLHHAPILLGFAYRVPQATGLLAIPSDLNY